jgi:hypothetical protein
MMEEMCWKSVIGDTFLMDVHVYTLTLQFYIILLCSTPSLTSCMTYAYAAPPEVKQTCCWAETRPPLHKRKARVCLLAG